MAFSGPQKWKFPEISSLHSPPRASQLQRCPKHNGAGIETWRRSWRFPLYMANHLVFTMRISKNHSNSILIHLVGWLFHALRTLANQWLANYRIDMICSNVRFFLLPTTTFWHSLGSIVQYSNTLEQVFEASKSFWEELLCSVLLSITDTILMFRKCSVSATFLIIPC